MKFIKQLGITLWKDESGQGTAEYALILVAVVAFALLFKSEIYKRLQGLIDGFGAKVSEFMGS